MKISPTSQSKRRVTNPTIPFPALAFLVLVLSVVYSNRAQAIDLTLYDHSTRPWFDAPGTAFDYPSLARVTIVTGTPNWPYNNVNLTNVRICNADGVPLIAGLNIPQGTPLGTVIYSTDVFGAQGSFPEGVTYWGYPHHIETYYGDPNPYVGDVVGSAGR